MSILDMPVEILDLIIDLTLPQGIESFVLSCKAVHERAKAQLQIHRKLKKWKNTTNFEGPRREDTLDIVYQISREPLIAEYITSLYLWDHRKIFTNHRLNSIDYDQFDFRTDNDAMAHVKDSFLNSELFTEPEVEEYWESIAQEQSLNDDAVEGKVYSTLLLLSLLPNLRKLQLPDEWYQVRKGEAGETLVPLVDSLVELSNSGKFTRKGLKRLETLLPFVEESYEYKVGLQCLQPFMVLKSIQNFYAVSCVAINQDWEPISFNWPDPKLQSPLTKIELAYCCIDTPGLASLLAYTPALKVFRYSHQTKWDELGFDWNPGEFLETIANFCGNQLRELALTIDDLEGNVANGLSSFLRLPNLDKLEVDVKSFCGPPLESGQRLGRNAIIPPEGVRAWAHNDIPCIGSFLPATVREVHVNAFNPGESEEALKALFKNIRKLREESLLLLQKVVIRQWGSGIWAQSIADSYGITLEIFERPENYPHTIMPLWKREFDRTVGGIVWGMDS